MLWQIRRERLGSREDGEETTCSFDGYRNHVLTRGGGV